MTGKKIDLNSDVGESFGAWTMGADEALMPYITSASIACGWHGGDPQVMRRTVKLARTHGVRIGAHPGYPDLLGFGRRPMQLSPAEATHNGESTRATTHVEDAAVERTITDQAAQTLESGTLGLF